MSEPRRRRRSLASIILFVLVLIGALWIILHRQYIVDQQRAWDFSPSNAVADLRTDLQLTSRGTFLFNASQPQLQTAKTFNTSCQQQPETKNPIIGCYSNNSIYIYDVTRSELDGIEETTAAHELLHAVYKRLSSSERATIDIQLQSAYDRVKTPKLIERMAYYEQAEPGQEMDELHSILGTEAINLGSVLEEHYAKYFTSRKQILAYHEAYSGVFDRVSEQITSLAATINQDVTAANSRIKMYNQNVRSLNSDTQEFNRRSQSGEFSSQAEFNAERAELINRKTKLDAEYNSISDAISSIKKQRNAYNQLVENYNQLSKSLNSSLKPTPEL